MKCFIDHALRDKPLWDVCCDHGYVGIKALETSQFSEVHFVDQVPHIMERLEILIKQYWRIKPQHKYYLHVISGECLEEDVEGTLLIAGVGGLTITIILKALLDKNKLNAQRLLLSPHTDEKVLIEYFGHEDFQKMYIVTSKVLMPEGKRMRPLYVVDLK